MSKVIDVEATTTEQIKIEDAIVVTNPKGSGLQKYGTLELMIESYKRTYSALVPKDLVIENDEQKAEVRNIRIGINKTNEANKEVLKEERKRIVSQIDDAIKTYNETVSPILDEFYQNAATAIANYDAKNIEEKTTELERYTKEKLSNGGVDFVEFTDLNISVTASKALSALRKEVDNATNTIITNVKSIKMMKDSERVEEYYKKHLDLDKAIQEVMQENEIAERLAQQAIEQERLRAQQEQQRAIKEAEERARQEALEQARKEFEEKQKTQEVKPQVTPTIPMPTASPRDNGSKMIRYRFDVIATSEDMEKALEALSKMGINIQTQIIETDAKIEDLF